MERWSLEGTVYCEDRRGLRCRSEKLARDTSRAEFLCVGLGMEKPGISETPMPPDRRGLWKGECAEKQAADFVCTNVKIDLSIQSKSQIPSHLQYHATSS